MSDRGTRISREPAIRWVAPDVGAAADSGQNQSHMTVGKLETLQQSAYDEAFTQGFEAGTQAGREALALQAEQLNACIEALSEPFRELDEQVEIALVNLAVRVARQIIRRELKIDPGQIVGVVRETIELLPIGSRSVEVHLHPEDAKVVRDAFGAAGTNLAWTLVEDPVLSRGGLQVTTETSQIDARVEKRLDAILATLVGGEREADG